MPERKNALKNDHVPRDVLCDTLARTHTDAHSYYLQIYIHLKESHAIEKKNNNKIPFKWNSVVCVSFSVVVVVFPIHVALSRDLSERMSM